MDQQVSPQESAVPKVTVRALRESDLEEADRIVRLAFGTFLGMPNPLDFMGDAGYVQSRWRTDPSAAFCALAGDELVGSNFAGNWGSVGFLGPLTVDPQRWNCGIGQRLMEPVVACFERWNIRHAGPFTFAHSQKHVALYQKFGFWPCHLTMVMSKQVGRAQAVDDVVRFSEFSADQRPAMLAACRALSDAVFEGLDLGREISTVSEQNLGDTVLLWDHSALAGFAVCHCGAGSEAGSGSCYIKFGVARPGPGAAQHFVQLLQACEALAAARGLEQLIAGVNTARHDAYRRMLERGFRTDFQGVAMQRPNEPGYNRAGVYLVDDWR